MKTNTSTIVFIAIATLFITGQAAPTVGVFPYVNRSGVICPTSNVSMDISAETAAATLIPPAPAGLPQSRRGVIRSGAAAAETLSQGSAQTNGQKPLKCEATPINEAFQAVQTSAVTATACDLDGQIISQEECDEGIATGRFVEADGELSAVDASYRFIRQLTTAATPPHKGRSVMPPKREATTYWVTAYAYS